MSQYCQLCERGFPVKDGFHVPTQALGMIPVTRCKAVPPKSKHVREQESRDNREAHAFIRLANPR